MDTFPPPTLALDDLSQPVHDYFSAPHRPTFDENRYDEDDIFRGEPPSPPRSIRSASPSSIASSSSSSSSNSSVFGGRLGAISTLVEHAIAHWARAWASSPSLASSSSSSSRSTQSSIITLPRSYISRHRRRRPSFADLHNAKSEREVAARIRAREELRQVSREFVLYTPMDSHPSKSKPRSRAPREENSGVLRTTSLPLILSELSGAMKSNIRTRRAQDMARAGGSRTLASARHVDTELPPSHHQDYMMPTTAQPSFADNVAGGRKGKKGKQRAEQSSIPQTPLLSRTQSESELDRAWWLDISSPTWEDMRAIGKLLHLHPLTLEDILQQDPREKLELFPKLGYYFIVFRAIESQKIRERRRMATIVTTDNRLTYPDEGNIGEVNVYLVVFREGICSFHFSDISDHADSVRSKVLMYAETGTVTMSSDWIAHGIMDSIVDSFFPFLEEIEKEVLNIEHIVYTDEQIVQLLHEEGKPAVKPSIAENSGSDSAVSGDSSLVDEKNVKIILSEKHEEQDVPRTHFSVPTRPPVFLRRFKYFIRKLRTIVSRVNVQVKRPVSSNAAPTTIQRVARMRRLVTSLSRVLATKSEVVAQVKKRLLMTGESGLGNGTVDDHDVFVYMGDVQDHILTLQQSLAHYERMLNQSHPTYLTQLRLSASKSKSGSDKSIMILSIISIGVLCVQGVIGFHSMNIKVPSNRIAPGGHFYVFGVVISLSVVILLIYAMLVRWWWIRARKKRNW